MRLTRRHFIQSAAAGLAAAYFTSTRKLGADKTFRPNILFILTDDLGYGDLSGYGAQDMHTPNIDVLIENGMKFNNFYANCPVCSPTRAALLTGRYPDLVGVPGVIRTYSSGNFGYLSPDAVLLPSMLKRAGYRTACIGKWHLGLESPNIPNDRGFDHFYGFLGDMMDDYYTHLRHDKNYMRLNKDIIEPQGHATDLFTQWAVEYLNNHQNPGQPFFLYLAYNAPHVPVQPPAEWVSKVREREPEMDEQRANLVALIEHMDDGIGKVIEALKENGMSENTLIVFTSDNGGQLKVGANNGDLRSGKQSMYEGGIKVPMCAVWPGHIKPGTTSNLVCMTMDWFPTLCDIAGIPVDHQIEGKSILPALKGEEQELNDRTIFWVRREGWFYGGRDYYAARYKNWKLVQETPFENYQLYDLSSDPLEQNPLTQDHEMYNKLKKELRAHIQQAGKVPWQKP